MEDHSRRTDSWHFEKRLSLDTLVALAGVAIVLGGPMVYWGRAMENRVLQLEIKAEERAKQEETRAKQEVARDLDARDQRITVLTRMDKIDEQVTQLRIDIGKLLLGHGPDVPMMRR